MATNKIDKAQHTIQFKEARKPGPLRQVFTKGLTATSASFEIAGPPDNGGLPIDSYVIQYKAERDTWDNPSAKSWPVGKLMHFIPVKYFYSSQIRFYISKMYFIFV